MKIARSLTLLTLLGAFPIFGFAQEGAIAEYRTERGVIRLHRFERGSVDLVNRTIVATGAGGTVVVEDTARGVTLKGRSMSVTLRQSPNGDWILVSATVSEEAELTQDTSIAFDAATAFAKRQSQAVPPAPLQSTVSRFRAERFTYALNGDEGTLLANRSVDYRAETKGTSTRNDAGAEVRVPFTQVLQATGASATVVIRQPEGGLVQPLNGRIEGPVKFEVSRNETRPNTEVHNTRIDGSSGSLVALFDGQKEPTITAGGGVEIDFVNTRPRQPGEGDPSTPLSTTANIVGEKVTLNLDPTTYEVVRYEFTGTPATTRLRQNIGSRQSTGGRK